MSDYFGLIAETGFQIAPHDILRLARLSAFTLQHLSDDQSSYGLTGERLELGHRIVIGNDPAEYWQRLRVVNKGFVRGLDRRERKLAQSLGPLHFEFDVGDKRQHLENLIGRKRLQYRISGVADALHEAWTRDLLVALAQTRARGCAGVLSMLHTGAPGLRRISVSGAARRCIIGFRNDAVASAGPGHLSIKQIVDNATVSGISVIDRGAGDQVHKSTYLTETHSFLRDRWANGSCKSWHTDAFNRGHGAGNS